MSRITQVILICIVAAAQCAPNYSPAQYGDSVKESVAAGVAGSENEVKEKITITAEHKEKNGDVGLSISGSAERPSEVSIHPGRPRPTVNDVISALQNLTTKGTKDANNGGQVAAGPIKNSEASNVVEQPNDSQPPINEAPVYPPELVYPGATDGPVYPPGMDPHTTPSGVVDFGVFPNKENNANNSIIILNLNDLQGLQYGGSNLMQLLSILNGKPGFVYVMSGGQGKFIPLNQLHLLPQNGVPSYVVLLTQGQPSAVPGLQLINGFYPNGNLGNLGFQIPNLGSFSSLPIYVVQGYYPIWTILMSLGLYQPNLSYFPQPNPTSYPIDFGQTTTVPTTPAYIIPKPTKAPVVEPLPTENIDIDAMISMLAESGFGNDDISLTPERDEVPDSELVELLWRVLKLKPGSETEHVIVQEKRNPIKLLHILIDLLGKQTGSEHVVINTQQENNPSRLLQILIQLLRQNTASPDFVISGSDDDSSERLIQLLMKLINQQQESHVVVSHNNGKKDLLMKIIMKLLSNSQQLDDVFISGRGDSSQSQLVQYLIQLLGASNPEAGNILISGSNDSSSAQRLYNILLQMISSMSSNDFGSSVLNHSGGRGSSGISRDSLMKLVQILLKQQKTKPFVIHNRQPSILSGGDSFDGANDKILTMLLGSGAGKSNKSALWSYLLGKLGCMTHNGRTLICAK